MTEPTWHCAKLKNTAVSKSDEIAAHENFLSGVENR